jgi:hypothetical protein
MDTAPAAAELLAARLPARRKRSWTVTTAHHGVRPGAPCARLTDGVRVLLVVQADATRLEVFAQRPGLYPYSPDIVADTAAPGAVGTLTGQLLRSVLPQVDAEIDHATADVDRSFRQVHRRRTEDLTELRDVLIGHGALPQTLDTGYGTPGVIWQAKQSGTWAVLTQGQNAHLTTRYDGPVSGLYAVLPLLLAPDAAVPTDAGTAFTRDLTNRFPQLRAIAPSEVELPGYCAPAGGRPGRREPSGFVLLVDAAAANEADARARVFAEFHIGMDLVLYLTNHLAR